MGGINMSKKEKKPFYKKWWFWLIIVIVVAAAATNDDDSVADSEKEETEEVDANTEETEKKEDEPKEEKEEEEESKEFSIGDQVDVGDITYTINEKSTTDEVGPDILPEKASDTYVVVDVTIKNNGNESITVDSNFFKLLLGDKTYEADSTASMSANQSDDGDVENSFFLQKVNPDSEITGNVVFDVSSDVAEDDELQLQVQTGAFGTETEVINLK